jgi:DNA polymerase III delta prime subunit
MAAPLYSIFRYAPPTLFAYWAWFHRQLRDEDRAAREWLYHLATTPTGTLERQEGVTLTGLSVVGGEGQSVLLGRERPLETRIREDDRVLLTPQGLRPSLGESIEGTIERLEAHRVAVRVRDRLDDRRLRYRLDDLASHDMQPWQTQGLTDFLVATMDATAARGRAIGGNELPPLAQAILGVRELPALPAEPSVPAGVGGLNAVQRRAVGAALALDPAAGEPLLVQGPPGTGKTTMIAELARAILGREFTRDEPGATERPLLILANSHRAVDEVLLKLATRYPDLRPYLVRVGRPRSGMEQSVRDCVLTERLGVEAALAGGDLGADGPARLVALIREGNVLHDEAVVFAGTLAAANRPELRGLAFRTVIVDETGQATEPAALQALRHLPVGYRGRLILVGDHRQLPPVVTEESLDANQDLPDELRRSGFDDGDTLRTSLFERLARRYPERLITLTDQYRMCGPISTLVAETFYDGALRPGSEEVAMRRLNETYARLGLVAPDDSLLAGAPPVVLIDTSDDPDGGDSVAGFAREEARINEREARLVARLVHDLFAGVPLDRRRELAAEIGVISPYRRQNNKIRQALAARDPVLAETVRVDTVDRFQGGERDVIVVSLTNSNVGAVIGSLHADWRRMNVALSRARRALVIVGDRRTFTLPGRPEEEAAKERYRLLFTELARLTASGDAAVVPARMVPA